MSPHRFGCLCRNRQAPVCVGSLLSISRCSSVVDAHQSWSARGARGRTASSRSSRFANVISPPLEVCFRVRQVALEIPVFRKVERLSQESLSQLAPAPMPFASRQAKQPAYPLPRVAADASLPTAAAVASVRNAATRSLKSDVDARRYADDSEQPTSAAALRIVAPPAIRNRHRLSESAFIFHFSRRTNELSNQPPRSSWPR